MRILSITAQKPHSTGSGTYLTELVKAFSHMGHAQAIVCGITPEDRVGLSEPSDAQGGSCFPEGVACYPVFFKGEEEEYGFPVLSFPVVGMSDIMPYESTRYRDMTPDMIAEFEQAFAAALDEAVSELDPDLIICHHLFLLTALAAKHHSQRRIVGICHGTDLRQMKACPELADLVRPYISGLDMVFALHSDQRESIISEYDIPPDRVSVLGSGYNSTLFNAEGRQQRSSDDPIRICYAGKLSRPKGVPELLRTFIMLDRTENLTLTLAGGCRDELVSKMLESLPDNIIWLGQISQPELASLFRSSDIFVLPSYFEGLPLVIIEAMASGALPVCTDLPGIREWADSNIAGSNLIYVPMPEMESIDTPTEEGRLQFICDLADALNSAIRRISVSGHRMRLPDTSSVTWDFTASRLLEL